MGYSISQPKQYTPPTVKPVVFSIEIFELVADYLFEVSPFILQSNKEPEMICCRKPPWEEVSGFMNASSALHSIGMVRWVSVLSIHTPQDWHTALRYRDSVRELNCLDGCFNTTESGTVLAHFRRLYTISIDSHSDIQRSADTGRFSYYTLLTTLPSSVLRLHVKNAHSPAINIINVVKRYAPNLEELWLGRCTMFNRSPACGFWSAFPLEHNSYIALEGTDDYAVRDEFIIAGELQPLQRLTTLYTGIYMAPSDIVLAHRVFHTRQSIAPQEINWEHAVVMQEGIQGIQAEVNTSIDISSLVSLLHAPLEKSFALDSCSFCRDGFFQDRIHAEKRANGILREKTNLKTISWMNWFSDSHLGLTEENEK
ncbi:hypothetical protein AG1IA_05536 [Rhizoctonia solani AG-1 IA]|uniref:Uncharacterized protein n=1 Tax=Thanatephorus cucumeris (strain AG1-IA) TaxID=983506 RepID=L8WUG7_THACA|nr:hypothetical protein AG1IA_05536 [Rhizoctonia solani AG-1 IA]